MPATSSSAGRAFELFANMPAGQLFFLVLAAVTWLVGGNVLVASHYRRLGKPMWSGFVPFAFPFAKFNGREWLWLFGLFVLAMTFGVISLSLR